MGDLLDDDFERATANFPDISLNGDSDIPTFASPPRSPPAPAGPFDLDAFGTATPAPARVVRVTGHDEDDDIGKFESEFPELDFDVPQTVNPPPSQPTFGALPPFAPRPQPSALSATPILNQPLDAEEPEVIRKWREDQAEEIQKRDERSKARRQETISKAERAIDQFYEDYNGMRKRQIRENKDSEAEYLASLSDSLSRGTTWDRISELIELQNSQSKTLARAGPGTTELSRYREVLLRLRREGESAPGAAGY